MNAPLRKSELTFASIVESASEIAAAQGIGRLSLGEVAKRLGMSKSGVFARIGSLEQLQCAILDAFDQRFAEEIFAPAAGLAPGLPRLNVVVEGWIRRVCNAGPPGACLYLAGTFEYDDVPGPLRERLQQGMGRLRSALRRMIQEAVAAGQLRSDTDAEQLLFELFSLIFGAMHGTRFLQDPQTEHRLRNAYARLLSTYRSFQCPA